MKIAAGLVALAATLSVGAAEAADITSANAKIQAGRLVITGTTLTPNMKMRLDGQAGAGFNTQSNGSNAFAFSLVYHPDDCIVTLQKLTGTSTLGAANNFVVADCGPRGVIPRGAYDAAAQYLTDDLITYQGSTWRAKRNAKGKTPGLPANAADWEQFAAKGAQGPVGVTARGAWSGGSYVAGDLVQFGGSTWRAKRANTNVSPVAGADWEILAQGGASGPPGAQGATGLVDIAMLGWSAFVDLPTGDPAYIFMGDPAPLAVTATQQLTGSASAVIGMPNGTGIIEFTLCYKPTPGAAAPFNAQNTSRAYVTGDSTTFATSSTVVPGIAGTYFVGLCGRSLVAASTARASSVSGWVTVTNTAPLLCSNGVVDPGETCDDGNNASGDGCSGSCDVEIGNTCTGVPSVCSADCGNGVITADEQCDDGSNLPGDGCSPTCRIEPGYFCASQPSVCAPVCGDGIISGAEQCDDGNTDPGDGCSDICTVEPP